MNWWLNSPTPRWCASPATANRSLSPYGIPCSGPRHSPAAISRSAWRASSCARPSRIVTAQSRTGSSRLRRSRVDLGQLRRRDPALPDQRRESVYGEEDDVLFAGRNRPVPALDVDFGALKGIAAALVPQLLHQSPRPTRMGLELQRGGFPVAERDGRRDFLGWGLERGAGLRRGRGSARIQRCRIDRAGRSRSRSGGQEAAALDRARRRGLRKRVLGSCSRVAHLLMHSFLLVRERSGRAASHHTSYHTRIAENLHPARYGRRPVGRFQDGARGDGAGLPGKSGQVKGWITGLNPRRLLAGPAPWYPRDPTVMDWPDCRAIRIGGRNAQLGGLGKPFNARTRRTKSA